MDTYAEYPQFRYSACVSDSVAACPDRSPQGYWSAEDTALNVTNLSQKYKMQILSVAVDGPEAAFAVNGAVILAPGETRALPLKGTLPAVSLTTADITVNYSLVNSITPLGSRTMTFTLMNGDPPAYDAGTPYTAALQKTAFDKAVPDGLARFTAHSGFFDFIKMILNSIIAVLRSVRIR